MKTFPIAHALRFLAILVLAVLTAHSNGQGQTASQSAVKIVKNVGNLSPTTQPFVHPGIYYNAADLEFMRKKLATKADPWFSAWEHNKPSAIEEKSTPHPVENYDSSTKEGGSLYWNGDAVTAHKLALQWALTGNQADADKAIEILNAWSSTLKTIIGHPKMPGEMVACGIGALNFANAAELLCYGGPNGKKSGWTEPDIKRFKEMLRIIDKPMEPFFPGYNGNWDGIMMNGMICAGVFLDDHAMFDHALRHYIEGEKPHGGLVNYIYASGQCQESGRDQSHVQWGLGSFISVCEVAWKQGIDIYGAYDNRLLKGLEYTANYNLGNDVPFQYVEGFHHTISADKRGMFASIWEAPYQHYVVRRGLEMPFTKQVVFGNKVAKGKNGETGPYRPEGTFVVGINWGTFTMFKSEEDPQATKKH